MGANYRCGEIKDEALELAKDDITNLKKKTDSEILSGFKEACMIPVTNAIKHYDTNASQYQTKVFQKVRKEVVESIMQNLF